MVLDIVNNSDQWATDAQTTDSRMTYFVPLLGHPNRRIHELAYLEIGRASYSDIKAHAQKWPVQDMRDLLENPQMLEWFPLAIMILGMNAEPRDEETILSRISLANSYGFKANLAAWITAYIEIRGVEAVERIEADFLVKPDREREQLEPLIVAMSVHGTNSPGELRNRVVDAYLKMLEVHPQMVSAVTRDLAAWKRWDTTKAITGIMDNWPESDAMSDFAVKSFLYQAERG